MNDQSSTEPKSQPKGWLIRIVSAWQWVVVLFFVLMVLVLTGMQYKLNAPGAPVALFWITVAAGGLVALTHAPSIFHRLPGRWKAWPYAAGLGFFVLLGISLTQVDAAWEKTPKGAAEAKQYQAEREEAARVAKIEAEAEARRQRDGAALKEAEALQEQVEEIADKLEGCFTTFGHRLPALEKSIKDSVHNPAAFEHVETLAIVPDTDRNNVAMKFRAENGYGAIRLGVVKASVDPDSCDVISIGNLEPM